MTDSFNLEKLSQKYNKNIQTGADAKRLQYDGYAEDLCYDKIDLTKILLNNHFKESDSSNNPNNCNNCVMINIAKDTIRYQSAIKEFEKISFNNFVHLRATYWKERTKMILKWCYHFYLILIKKLIMK
jgi:hypothetical protein